MKALPTNLHMPRYVVECCTGVGGGGGVSELRLFLGLAASA